MSEVHDDIAAFADDDEDLVIDPDGTVLFVRNGVEVVLRLVVQPSGRLVVQFEGEELRYRSFLTHHLARLDVLAERLIAKRPGIEQFVDGPAQLDSGSEEPRDGRAVGLLARQCDESSPFASRVIFLTADAGFGKTALLRHLQAAKAHDFLEGNSPYLFWHVDLQGRQLLRLSEALMGDLAELRVSGLWMPGVIRLLRKGALVLAIDGFDELAAEQGTSDALGALANLVGELGEAGKIVAASRRTFFDTDSYLRRVGLLRRRVSALAEFDQLSLLPWGTSDAIELIERTGSEDPQRTYREISDALGGDPTHPMLTRPFLLHLVARAASRYSVSPAVFIRGMDDPLQGVAAVVESFVKREVTEKWKHRETGEPYLTFTQHMELLANVAEEMYLSQKDRIPLETVEAIAAILLDDWQVNPQYRPQIVEMLRMHVLLNPPPDGDMRYRSFDHPEFRDYFVAYWMSRAFATAAAGSSDDAARLLSVAPITDSTARYVTRILDLQDEARRDLVGQLVDLAEQEWRPSHLRTNVGTLVPYLIDNLGGSESPIRVGGSLLLSSLVLEGKSLLGLEFDGCTFINVTLAGSRWKDVVLNRCSLGVLTIDSSTCSFENVTLRESTIDGLTIRGTDNELRSEYAPERIRTELERLGISTAQDALFVEEVERPESQYWRLAQRILRVFNRSTFFTDDWLQTKLGGEASTAIREVVPLLEENGVIAERVWRGQGQRRIWTVQTPLEEVLAADSSSASGALAAMWDSLRNSP